MLLVKLQDRTAASCTKGRIALLLDLWGQSRRKILQFAIDKINSRAGICLALLCWAGFIPSFLIFPVLSAHGGETEVRAHSQRGCATSHCMGQQDESSDGKTSRESPGFTGTVLVPAKLRLKPSCHWHYNLSLGQGMHLFSNNRPLREQTWHYPWFTWDLESPLDPLQLPSSRSFGLSLSLSCLIWDQHISAQLPYPFLLRNLLFFLNATVNSYLILQRSISACHKIKCYWQLCWLKTIKSWGKISMYLFGCNGNVC